MSFSMYPSSSRGSPSSYTTSSSRGSSPSSSSHRGSPTSIAAATLTQSISHVGSSVLTIAQIAFKRACDEIKHLDIDITNEKYRALNAGILHAFFQKTGYVTPSSPDFMKLDGLIKKWEQMQVKSSGSDSFNFLQSLRELRAFFLPPAVTTASPKDRYKLLFNALTGLLSNPFYHADFKCFLNQESLDSSESDDGFEEINFKVDSQNNLELYPRLSIDLEEARGIESLINNLVEVFFLDVDINSASYPMIERILVEAHHQPLKASQDSSSSLKDLIESDFTALDNLPLNVEGSRVADKLSKSFNNALGHLDLGFSPMRLTNLVHTLSQRSLERRGGDSKDLKVIRMGCPTYTDTKQTCQVEPLFLRFIENCKHKGHKHGYFNLQNDRHKADSNLVASIRGDETRRIDALKRVSNHHPGTFSHFIFPMDNDFWHNAMSRDMTFYDFAAKVHQLFITDKGKESAFLYPDLSSCARKNNELSSKMLNKVLVPLQELFSLTSTGPIQVMSPEKHRAFLFMTYVALSQVFVQQFDLDTCNFSCKDGIDRGGTFNAVFEYMQELYENREAIADGSTKEKALEAIHLNLRLRVNQFSLLVKQQAVVPPRRQNFLDAVDFISKNPEAVIRFMKAVHENAKQPLV